MTKEEPLEQAIAELVERLGRAFEQSSALPRIAGRVLALLLLEEGPHSFADLSARLRISRGSVSSSTHLLEDRGMIERVGMLGDRRDFFRVADSPFSQMAGVIGGRIESNASLLEESASSLPEEARHARANLLEAARVHHALADALSGLSTRRTGLPGARADGDDANSD